jgi:hypothetical protein
MARSFNELAGACNAAADNIEPAIMGSFRTAIKRAQPRFRDAARSAAGPDRILSRHRSKAPLDAQMTIAQGRRPYLMVRATGPWGIRDSTDAGSNRTAAHRITPKQKKILKFNVDGTTVYARVVNHPGSRRSNFWEQGRKEALNTVATRIPPDVSEAIVAAFSGSPFKGRTG